jgi:23S rRNA (uridine2552-2'-O)-methyltransferase
MSRTKSSRRWLDRHFSDEYVKRAQREGYRSRAVYKLLEIQEKDRILAPCMRVVDLGAAPGGWSQVAARIVGPRGRVVALDLLPMEPLPGVSFIQGDFREDEVLEALRAALEGEPVDLVLSDMAPNVSGNPAVDQPRMIYLCELALALTREVLKPGGSLVVKAFQGEGFDALLKDLRGSFRRVASRKPKSSRSRSRELYLVATGYSL